MRMMASPLGYFTNWLRVRDLLPAIGANPAHNPFLPPSFPSDITPLPSLHTQENSMAHSDFHVAPQGVTEEEYDLALAIHRTRCGGNCTVYKTADLIAARHILNNYTLTPKFRDPATDADVEVLSEPPATPDPSPSSLPALISYIEDWRAVAFEKPFDLTPEQKEFLKDHPLKNVFGGTSRALKVLNYLKTLHFVGEENDMSEKSSDEDATEELPPWTVAAPASSADWLMEEPLAQVSDENYGRAVTIAQEMLDDRYPQAQRLVAAEIVIRTRLSQR